MGGCPFGSQRIPGTRSVASFFFFFLFFNRLKSVTSAAFPQAFLGRYDLTPPLSPVPINLASQSAQDDPISSPTPFKASKVATLASLPSRSRVDRKFETPPPPPPPWPQPPPLLALRSFSSLMPSSRRSRSAAHPPTTRPMRTHPHPWTKTRLRQDGRRRRRWCRGPGGR